MRSPRSEAAADRDDVEAGAPAAAQEVGAARRARVAGEGDEEADPWTSASTSSTNTRRVASKTKIF